jgi:hypothetical protein
MFSDCNDSGVMLGAHVRTARDIRMSNVTGFNLKQEEDRLILSEGIQGTIVYISEDEHTAVFMSSAGYHIPVHSRDILLYGNPVTAEHFEELSMEDFMNGRAVTFREMVLTSIRGQVISISVGELGVIHTDAYLDGTVMVHVIEDYRDIGNGETFSDSRFAIRVPLSKLNWRTV